MSDSYIHRRLTASSRGGSESLSDTELAAKTGVIMVLAEPGAGKTELLNYLSRQLNSPLKIASVFRHEKETRDCEACIVDGLDEVARLGEEGTNDIFVKARDSGARTIVLASRSYVWDEARTQFVRDCFGQEPLLIRVEPLDQDEQRRLFETYKPEEDFSAFLEEVDRFDLGPILGNPQFMLLFADAFVQGGRRFSSKARIYKDAAEALAAERNSAPSHRGRPPTESLLDTAGEVFAKLLLCGEAGVSLAETPARDGYPYIFSLSARPADHLSALLNTRLFKPSWQTGKHEPVHRIVEEYCAARYLVGQIDDATAGLSLRRCLAIIAPNATVRDELRGMLGWMAALGSRRVQEAAIDLDPYTVFANGDPSLLAAASKRQLLRKLGELAEADPYFRRHDGWRQFNAAGFFNDDIVGELRQILTTPAKGSHLPDLLLRLIGGSPVIGAVSAALQTLMLDANGSMTTRLLAQRSLVEVEGHDHGADLRVLVNESSPESLRIACELVAKRGTKHLRGSNAFELLRACATRYPTGHRQERAIELRYSVESLIGEFDLTDVADALDELTRNLACICGASKVHQCHCRDGISKIVGALLDRYFYLSEGPYSPKRVWEWIRNLVFHGGSSVDRSVSVKALAADDELRQAIHRSCLVGKTTNDELWEARQPFCSFMLVHSGLGMQAKDVRALVDYAFENDDLVLWEHFRPAHNLHTTEKGVDPLRKHMRGQARLNLKFQGCWSSRERKRQQSLKRNRERWPRSAKKYERRDRARRDAEARDFQRDRGSIESGRHWGWLHLYARHYLYQPEKLVEVPGGLESAEKALLNGAAYLAPHVPSLKDLAAGQGLAVAEALHATALAVFRARGRLRSFEANALKAIRTDAGSCNGYREGEAELLQTELDQLLFPNESEALAFAIEYFEPQFTRAHVRLSLLQSVEAFRPIRGALANDWLKRYPHMPFNAMESLFSTCARDGDRHALCAFIEMRCREGLPLSAAQGDAETQDRRFWLLRHFFFIPSINHELWREFSADRSAVLEISRAADPISRADFQGWPRLSAEKVFQILHTYVDVWPKVYLPSSYGTGSPEGEMAYRFLKNIVWNIGIDQTSAAVPVLDRILNDTRFADFENDAKSIKAGVLRRQALATFSAPSPRELGMVMERRGIASVEDMRALLVDLLDEHQKWLHGAATDPLDVFYSGGKHVDENTARNRIAERLEARLNAMNVAVAIEHHMAKSNRCDIAASTAINGRQLVLVTEVKGQWNLELFTAAEAQLADRYMNFPGAAGQGLYLVLWFGNRIAIAGKKQTAIRNPGELKDEIERRMPTGLRPFIDVVVLDLSRPSLQNADT
jgi:hypothetical protein